ncbi:nickel-binding protein [Flindersiella endophytica]
MATRSLDDVPRYLVEWYRPALRSEPLKRTAERINRLTGEMFGTGPDVSLLLTLYVPRDEVAFCLFAADSADSVALVCRRAELPYERIAEATETMAYPA